MVRRNPGLTILGLNETGDAVLVQHDNKKTVYGIFLDTLGKLSPALAQHVCGGGRLLKHITRIVGYFSVTQNWNASKITELADRQKGNYKFNGGSFEDESD